MQVRLRLRQEIREILKFTHTTAIFVTHDQEEALALCDRVAVMQSGRLQQIGTPQQIYQEPATRFVAEFITQANFLPARWHHQAWQTEIGAFCPPVQSDRVPSEGETAELMIRQEEIDLKLDATGMVTVHDRQFLGRDYRYLLRTAIGEELQVRSPDEFAVGEHVRLVVHPQSVRVFRSR